jgi:subtilisin-like proprotein convertase family protein
VPDSFTIVDVNVTLNISHTNNSDLIAELVAPNGTRVTLFSQVGGASDGFSNTTFDDQASLAITNGSGPFSGSYRPESLLSVFNGIDAAGLWKLEIRDTAVQNSGTLQSWSLQFSYEVAAPLAQVYLLPTLSMSTPLLQVSRGVEARRQAFAAPVPDVPWAAAAAASATTARWLQLDTADEVPEEDSYDDLYAALDLALEAAFSLGL